MWVTPPQKLELAEHAVHVWRASLDLAESTRSGLEETLSADERLKAARYHFERDRWRYVVGRGTLRTILSRYLQVQPRQLEFCYGLRGKPALAEPFAARNLQFSVSHSQGLALYAVTRRRQVGIDVEQIRDFPDVMKIAERFLSKQEAAELRDLPENERLAAFFKFWTRKEAHSKATGDGIAYSDPPVGTDWFFQELTPEDGWIATMAVEGGQAWQLSLFRWQS